MGYEELASRLLSVGKEHLSACIGIDGFIDRILRVVD